MTAAAERGNPRRWWCLAILSLSVVLVAIDNTIVNVALPTLQERINASTSDLQWIVDAYTVCFASLLLVGGNIGDRLGCKSIMQVGLVVFAAASLVASQTSSFGGLVGSRAAMGVAAALVYPSTLAMLPALFRDRVERAIAVGIWSGVSGIAIALGPIVGGALIEHYSWGSIFIVNIPVALIALVLGATVLPAGGRPDEALGRFDIAGAALSVSAVGLLVYSIIEAPKRGWTSMWTVGGIVVALALVVAFAWWELHQARPMLDVRQFAIPRFSAASATIAIAYFALFGFTFMITMFFQMIRGYSTLRAGVATLPYAVVMAALSPLAIVIMHKVGTKVIVSIGMALMGSGLLVAARASVEADYWSVIVVSMCLMAAGMALATGPATDSILSSLPEDRAGVGSAVNDTTRELGGALGVAIVGSTMSWYFGHRLAQRWSDLVDSSVISQGRRSVGDALGIAAAAPSGSGSSLLNGVRDSFMSGLHAGSYIAAGAAFAASLAAVVWLPQRDAVVAEPGVTVDAP